MAEEKYRVIDFNNWSRKQHFEFYKTFQQPFFQLGCDIEAAALYRHCKNQSVSFFEAYLYLTQKAINQIEALCRRNIDGEVRIYQEVTISVTVMAPDDTFRFCNLPYCGSFSDFTQAFKLSKEKAVAAPLMDDDFGQLQQKKATVYMSVIPWFSFTGYRHAWKTPDHSGIPRIVFGKMTKHSQTMPLTVDAHHALVDGLDVAKFVETLQNYFEKPEVHL